MGESKDVSPINALAGMTVLSLSTGNKLGQILDLLIDPINGVPLGITVSLLDHRVAGIAHDEIYSFGRDAVMARTDQSITPLDTAFWNNGQPAGRLIGTKIITENGDVLGRITNVFVTLKPPPRILYEGRHSFLDKLLGREFYVPASVGHALSDDAARLVVPDITMDIAASDLSDLIHQNIEIRSFGPAGERPESPPDYDDTVVIHDGEDETVVRLGDDGDETVVRQPRR